MLNSNVATKPIRSLRPSGHDLELDDFGERSALRVFDPKLYKVLTRRQLRVRNVYARLLSERPNSRGQVNCWVLDIRCPKCIQVNGRTAERSKFQL